jgi:hypothetical protein
MASRIQPEAINEASYRMAREPMQGAEYRVFFSGSEHGMVSTVKADDSSGSIAYPARNYATTGTITLAVAGSKGLLSSAETPSSLVRPAWVSSTSKYFPPGYSFISDSEMNAEPILSEASAGDELNFVTVPDYDPESGSGDTTSWTEIQHVRSVSIELPHHQAAKIPDRKRENRFFSEGELIPGNLTIRTRHIPSDGMLGIRGMNLCAMLQCWKGGYLHIANIFVLNWSPSIQLDGAEGDEPSAVVISGQFLNHATVLAP